MRGRLQEVLDDIWATHNQRLWFVGFLKSVGYSADDIIEMIDSECKWAGYDPDVTRYQVESVFGGSVRRPYVKMPVSSCKPVAEFTIPPDLDSQNMGLFDGAVGVAYEYALGKFNRRGPMVWEPNKFPIYRTIEGVDHHLFVIDIDGDELDECYRVSKEIFGMTHWDWYKFSGNKGYHLIQKRKGKPDYESMRLEAELIAGLVGVSFSYKPGSGVNIDPRMYHRNQLIRGFCVNMKSGNKSIRV